MDGKDKMASNTHVGTRFTYDDFLLFPDDGKRHEIIDGVHYVTPAPNLRHQELLGRLYLALGNFLATRKHVGRVFFAPFDVVLSNYDVVEPDLLFIAGDQMDILTMKNVQGPPALVVEILSPGTRKKDEQIKRQLFDQAAVREYWLVDPELDLIKVFRRDAAGQFLRVAELTREDHATLETPLIPGFALALDDLFAAS